MRRIVIAAAFAVLPVCVLAQSVPNGTITQGQKWTATQWNTAWQSKADVASPALTGTPTAPTATVGTNTTQIATTAFVKTATDPLAPLASPTFTGTITLPGAGTISASGMDNTPVGQVTPAAGSFTTITPTTGIVGTTSGTAAPAGDVGQVVEATSFPSGVSLTTATKTNIVSLSVPAGDWNCSGYVDFISSANVGGNIYSSPSTVSDTYPTGNYFQGFNYSTSAANVGEISGGFASMQYNFTATTTLYVVGQMTFASGTGTAKSWLQCRRAR